MTAIPNKLWTVEDYLAFERDSPEKHEFIGGEVYSMSGASREHNLIVGNTFAALHTQLRGQPCESYMADMRVRIQRYNYVYPDITVVCGNAEIEHDVLDTLFNPTLIIEVLSSSTEKYDRGDKFEGYRTLASFQEYLLIAQDRPHIEHYVRQEAGIWRFTEAQGLEAVIELPSIGATLALADVYERVAFDSEER